MVEPASGNARQLSSTEIAIVEAFHTLAIERRYGEIRVIDIIDRADVGKSTFYEHFQGKDDVLLTAMRPILLALATAASGRAARSYIRPVIEHLWERRSFARPILDSTAAPILQRRLAETVATHEWAIYQALPAERRIGAGYLVNYFGRPVQDVDRAWDSMLVELEFPTGREWRPYVLRHSLATIVRKRGATAWDLQGYMGHLLPSQTEVYVEGDFATVQTALQSVIDEIERLVPGSLHRNDTGPVVDPSSRKEAKMSG